MGRKNVGKSGGNTKRAISHVKRNNLKRHKLVKAGKLKPKSSPRFVEGGHLKGRKKAPIEAPEVLEERERIRKEEAKQWVILFLTTKRDNRPYCQNSVMTI